VHATYLRDGRAPVPRDPRTSALMSRIKGRDTTPERQLRAALRAAGLTGYRLHYKHVPGRPDVAFVGLRVAVFMHGCFWHGCPHCERQAPKSNRTWWQAKLQANKARDARKARALRAAGWSVVTLWECRLREQPDAQVRRVLRALERRRALQPLRPSNLPKKRFSKAQKKVNWPNRKP
jgi:DNA mismatch endonuclease (patch repair protein)